jgi:hypothetical protein
MYGADFGRTLDWRDVDPRRIRHLDPDRALGQEQRSGSRSLLDLKARAVTREAQHASGEVAGDNDQGPR